MTREVQFNFKNTLMETLGIEIIEFTKERVTATMPVIPRTHQPFGVMHGGVSVALAETVASSGSYLFIDPDKQHAVGLEINANHICAVASGIVRAIGVPVHVGRSTLVWDIRIYDEQDNLICISRCTMAIIDNDKTSRNTELRKL